MESYIAPIIDVILFIAGVVISGLGFWVKGLKNDLDELETKFTNFQLNVIENYATRQNIQENFDKLYNKMDELFKEVHKKG